MDDIDKDKFCIMPFLHMEIQTQGGVFSCCHSNNPQEIGHLYNESLEAVWSGDKLKKFKSAFLNKESLSLEHCHDCFYYESLDAKSWRQVENNNWNLDLKKALNNEVIMPKSLGIRFSNLCNFSCRTCRPSTSSGWFKDAAFLNPKGDYHKIESTPSTTSMLEQVMPFLDTLTHIYFAGGEPLLEKEHYLILEEIIKRGLDIELSYDTNLSVLGLKSWNAIELWKNFSKVNLSASIDGFGAKGEFIRKGLDWDLYLENWNLVKKECPSIRMMMNFTLSIYNMFHVLDFIDEVIRLDLYNNNDPSDLTISLVEEPSWQSLQALPLKAKEEVSRRYENYQNLSFGKVKDDLDIAVKYMMGADKSSLLSVFKNFNGKLDLIRAEEFVDLFKEEAIILDMK